MLFRSPFTGTFCGETGRSTLSYFVVATRKGQANAEPILFKSYDPDGTYKIWESA